MENSLTLFTDGGSRGNPGPSSSAIYFPESKSGIGVYVGDDRTNNEAEYEALILGAEYAVEKGHSSLQIYSDSMLVVKQIKGDWQVKSESLEPLYKRALLALYKLSSFEIDYVPRKENSGADSICNAVLDAAEAGNKMLVPTEADICTT